jgi:hypothetical protein
VVQSNIMKKNFLATTLFICFYVLLTGCENPPPEKYFGIAVLNSNLMVGFANDGFHRELDQPSAVLVEGTKDQSRPKKRKEVVDDKIRFLQENLDKLKDLKETPDTKAILQASIILHEFILPVYKNEYQQLAHLYDDGAPADSIRSTVGSIHDKYSAGFEERYNYLINSGKLFATRNKIPVNWAD